MAKRKFIGVEEARKIFPSLVDSARHGETTVITRHGKPYAAVGPFDAASIRWRASEGILALRGSGRGLYGDVARSIDEARREWG
jgi:antitoxin (DNA-binding transcriptional repressor) of toxin-antitoxin stability system